MDAERGPDLEERIRGWVTLAVYGVMAIITIDQMTGGAVRRRLEAWWDRQFTRPRWDQRDGESAVVEAMVATRDPELVAEVRSQLVEEAQS